MPDRDDYPLRPRDLALLLLASGETLPRKRARDQQADRAGLDLKRRLLDRLAALDPEPEMMESTLMQIVEEMMPLYGTPLYARLSARQKSDLRYHSQVHNLSQFLHGEQGALVCAARIVKDVPTLESKFYAATQVMDEARHVEAYRRLLKDKFRFAYPISPPLKRLLEQALADRRWDFTYLGMQVLIEGLALAAFQRIRDYAKNALCQAVNAYVMQDEARHVAFGRIALREYYPQLSDAERREREEFVIEGSYFLRDRLNSAEMWEAIGIEPKDAMDAHYASEGQVRFRKRLFSRIVPTVKDIGLWGEGVRNAFVDMGAIEFADIDSRAVLEQDQRVAEEFDAGRFVREALA